MSKTRNIFSLFSHSLERVCRAGEILQISLLVYNRAAAPAPAPAVAAV